ncbi:MAG: efflux RND transporter periplasmic adaptor subunit [Acidobacteria bacterium]|nr:efflux RND transporter periplasmic adaptor subunit [Acidobacteriota bacterium]
MHFKTGLAVAALAAASCGGGQAAGPGQGMPPTPVGLAAAQARSIEETTEYVATLKSLNSTTIQPQIDGQITQIWVRSGDRVKPGDRLMQVDARRQQAALSSQEAERASREANVNFARQQAGRARELLEAGAISRQELEQAETGLRTAEAALQSLDAQVRQQQVQLRYYTITAPTAGVVGDIPVRVGFHVTPQTELTTIAQNGTLEVYVNVPLERGPDLVPGLPLRVRSGSSGETLAVTEVGFIAPSVDETTQSILVKGTVPNPDGRLRSSQFVRAEIVWGTHDAITVPVTAVGRLGGQSYVFAAEEAGGKLVARQRVLTLGPIVGNDYPVVAGLEPGVRIVVSGAQKLFEGAPIAEAPAGPPPGGAPAASK